jgi:hypothetical protein
MSIAWLIPAALWGLVALAVPVLVHLLTRQERRAIEFPTLRFLRTTRLAATRRLRIRDWVLLAIRAATIAAAVAALAGPLLVTPARERDWNARTARAIVTLGEAQAPADEAQSAFSSRVIAAGARAAEAVRAAVEWLATQPPAAREVVIVGDLREGVIDDADVAGVPTRIGIRFVPQAEVTPTNEIAVPVLTLANEAPAIEQRRVLLSPDETFVDRKATGAQPARLVVEMRASPEDQRAAEAALTALLEEGLVTDARQAATVIVVWPGGALRPGSGLSNDGNVLVLRMRQRPGDVDALSELRVRLTQALDDPTVPLEPRRVAAADLARWSRTPGPAPGDAVKQEEGDRRVLWTLVLALLVLEWWVRRADRAASVAEEAAAEEDRVA